ncbi:MULTISPECIES: carbohydrate ABC transporter permease [unclassified Streptomyces]|uniref:carbohydrate ABC transporter permease n=1 Tax=unclassified Streptomyces TaxID=2593676 RepID=UPI003812DAF1
MTAVSNGAPLRPPAPGTRPITRRDGTQHDSGRWTDGRRIGGRRIGKRDSGDRRGSRRRDGGGRGDGALAALFVAPAMAGFLVFLLWPTLRGVYLGFTRYNLLTPAEWVGLDNYRRMIDDPIFWGSMRVTLEYVFINIGVQTVVALCIAVLMQRLTNSSLLRGVVLMPYLVSNVVAGVVFLWILDTQLGIGNQILEALGFDRVAFLAGDEWVIPSVALINVWRHVGYTALLLFAGLQAIPGDVYEAARVDGAGELRMFWRISLPLLRPVLAVVMIMTVIGSFQVFDTVAVATPGPGGPANASNVLQLYIYDSAFGRFQLGYASAMSVALLAVLSVITIVQYRITRAGETDLG